MLLLVIGWILWKHTNIPKKAVPAAAQSEAPAPGALTCRHCGAKAEPDDIYCIECGEKL